MRLKIFEFNRRRQTAEAFEADVREFVKSAPTVTDMKLWENLSNSALIVQLTLGDDPIASQDFSLWPWIDLETAEGIANTTLEAVSHAGKKAQYLNLITLSKSDRAVLAMIVQGESGPHGTETEQTGKEAPAESHPTVNEVADHGAKRGKQHRDRKAST